MELSRTEEQAELAAIVRGLLEKRSDAGAVRAAIESEAGYDTALWATLAEEIGAAALNIPEELGGAGFTIAESLVVLEELGRALAPSPLLGTVIAVEALVASGAGEAAERLLGRIAEGAVACVALGPDNVVNGSSAEVVLAVVDGSLVEVDPSVTRTSTPAVDLTLDLATLDLAGASTTVLSSDPAVVDRIRDVAVVAAAAVQVGTMQRALDDTVEYSKQRVQFGRVIGSFQALKHRMADMLVRLEMSRSALLAASWALSTHAEDASERAAVAGSYVSESLWSVAGEMVQLHGGIAITWEHDAHLVLKRAHALGTVFGQAHEHRARIAV
ncbi:MAG: acyl-CoA dehydrogenase family protein [Nocardioides sp.]|uniref:acyl-CoA dehydrogenase family protein n=1 Tax=Nocardioides sp. TaxID=35761 RepID=UPI003F01C2DD